MIKVNAQVNTGRKDSPLNIAAVEEKYQAQYVGQLCLRDRHGSWVNNPVDVFYQPHPDVEQGHSHYFALFPRNGSLVIAGGDSAVEEVIYASRADDGELVYSRYRHDFRQSTDGSVWIDGGRDYTRSGRLGRIIPLKVIDGDWFQLEEGDDGWIGD